MMECNTMSFNILLKKCDSFKYLKRGWDGYNAKPPNSISIEYSKHFLKLLSCKINLPSPRIAPSVEEGVGISFNNEDKYLNIEFFNSGEIIVGTSDKNGNVDIKEFEHDNEIKILEMVDNFFHKTKTRVS